MPPPRIDMPALLGENGDVAIAWMPTSLMYSWMRADVTSFCR